MKIVVTIVGKDQVGIIASVSSILADNNVNILNLENANIDSFINNDEIKTFTIDIHRILQEKKQA